MPENKVRVSGNQALSVGLTAMLALILSDLCAGRPCNIGLYDFRNELWVKQRVLAALSRIAAERHPSFRIEPVEYHELKGLLVSGAISFVLVNGQGERSAFQLGGADPGVFPCQLATQ
jgi:hypothetical protein